MKANSTVGGFYVSNFMTSNKRITSHLPRRNKSPVEGSSLYAVTCNVIRILHCVTAVIVCLAPQISLLAVYPMKISCTWMQKKKIMTKHNVDTNYQHTKVEIHYA